MKFTGQATIVPGWSAGYVLHLEAMGSDSLTTSQIVPSTARPSLDGSPTTASARCSRSGSSRATTRARCRLVSSRRLRTTRPFSLTVRARSFLPTGCRSTSTASSSATRQPELSPRFSGAAAGGCVWGDCNGFRRTRFVTTRRRSAVSRCRHHGVKTTSGMSPHATLVNGRTSNRVRRGCVQPRFGFLKSAFWSRSATWHSLRVAITSRSVPTPSTSRQACSSTAPTVISIRTAISLRTTLPTNLVPQGWYSFALQPARSYGLLRRVPES